MLRRRVPVLRLGSRGPGGDQKSLRLCSQAPASVTHFWELIIIPKRRTVVTFYVLPKVLTIAGIGGVVVEKRRPIVAFGLAPGLGVSKVPTVTGMGGVVVAKHRSVVTFGLAQGLGLKKYQQSQGSEGSWSKRSPVNTFGLALGLRV